MDQTRAISLADLLIRHFFLCGDRERLKKYLDPDVVLYDPEHAAELRGADKVSQYLFAKRKDAGGILDIQIQSRCVQNLSDTLTGVSVFLRAGKAGSYEASFLHVFFIFKKRDRFWRVLHLRCFEESSDKLRLAAGATLLDPLTGISNMEGLVIGIESLFKREPDLNFALLSFGINDFRYINKLYGYQVGDRILKMIAKNIRAQCREHELCGRVGGDDFALLVRYSETGELEERVKQLKDALIDPEINETVIGGVHINSGVYHVIPEDESGVKDILDKARLAQKSAVKKKWESHYAFYHPDMERSQIEQQYLLEQAVLALQKREFQVYIQPQVDIRTLEPVGGEALVRWIKSDGSVIMPGTFIPLLESSGFIREFDFYMLRQLCSHLRSWLDAGLLARPISINQSRLHLKDGGYFDRFCRTVDMWEIPHELISFELTESVFTDYNKEVHTLSRELRAKGFRLDIDDFGTGYTALNLFSTVTADVLKIDQSVLACFQSPKGGIVIKKIIEMAQEIGMSVICEGVETREQLDFLRGLGCDMGQGYYFYRPMPAEAFRANLLKPIAGDK